MSPLVVELERKLERERERKRKLERNYNCPGGLCPFPQFQCVYVPSRLSVPIV